LAKTVSWEKTVEDLVHAIDSGALGILGHSRHVIIRLDPEVALYVYEVADGCLGGVESPV